MPKRRISDGFHSLGWLPARGALIIALILQTLASFAAGAAAGAEQCPSNRTCQGLRTVVGDFQFQPSLQLLQISRPVKWQAAPGDPRLHNQHSSEDALVAWLQRASVSLGRLRRTFWHLSSGLTSSDLRTGNWTRVTARLQQLAAMRDSQTKVKNRRALAEWLRTGGENVSDVSETMVNEVWDSLRKDENGEVLIKDSSIPLSALQNAPLPAGGPGLFGGAPFTWDDALTLIPGLLVVVLFSGLVGSFMMQIIYEDMIGSGSAQFMLDKSGQKETKGSSGPATVFNITKNIVGEGMLSLPAGVAAGTGILGAVCLASLWAGLLAYSMSVMGRVCHATGGATHKMCAEKASGPGLAQTMAITLVLKTTFTCLSYGIVIGESLSRIFHFLGFNGILASKQVVLLTVTAVILLPLCLQRDLSVLSFTSLFGVCGEFFVVMFMQVRYLDGSYTIGGKHYDEISQKYQPDFNDNGTNYWGMNVTTFVLLGSLSTAYIAHYNGPKFYSQMRTKTVAQFNKVVTLAFLFSLAIYIWIMCVGYLTFGRNADGLILNNYSEADVGATIARICIAFAVIGGYPLAFTALRDSAISALSLDPLRSDVWAFTTLAIMVPVTVVSCMISDLGLVNSFGGAFFGAMIVLIFPGILCYFSAKNTSGGKAEFTKAESKFAWVLVIIGVILCVFGSTVVLLQKFSPQVFLK